MHKLRFVESVRTPALRSLIDYKYRHSACALASGNYYRNLARVQDVARIVGFSFLSGQYWGTAVTEISRSRPDLDKYSLDVTLLAKTHFDGGFSKKIAPNFQGHLVGATTSAENICCQFEFGHEGFHAVLQTIVILSWTAFEVMAEDLWRRVVKQRPKLDTRTKSERNASGHRSRSKIASLYKLTFRHDNAAIMRAVDSHKIHALALVRNVLVHNGGRIDSDFVKGRKTQHEGKPQRGGLYLRQIRGTRAGYKIPFTGELVRSLVDPVVPLGFRLVRAVDRWLINHP